MKELIGKKIRLTHTPPFGVETKNIGDVGEVITILEEGDMAMVKWQDGKYKTLDLRQEKWQVLEN